MSLTYGKTPGKTLKEEIIDLQDMIDFIEDMKKITGKHAECDTMIVVEALMTLDGELESYNVEVTNG